MVGGAVVAWPVTAYSGARELTVVWLVATKRGVLQLCHGGAAGGAELPLCLGGPPILLASVTLGVVDVALCWCMLRDAYTTRGGI